MSEDNKPAKSAISEEEKQEIRKLYKNGAKWLDLEKRWSAYTIAKALKGMKRRRKPRKGTKRAIMLERRLSKQLDTNKAIQLANAENQNQQQLLQAFKTRFQQAVTKSNQAEP